MQMLNSVGELVVSFPFGDKAFLSSREAVFFVFFTASGVGLVSSNSAFYGPGGSLPFELAYPVVSSWLAWRGEPFTRNGESGDLRGRTPVNASAVFLSRPL